MKIIYWQVLITGNPNKFDDKTKQTYLDFEAAYLQNGSKCDVIELEPD